jgi:hypothetical protein
LYLSKDGKNGYTIKPNGEFLSVFSHPGTPMGRVLIEDTIKMGPPNRMAWPTNWNHDRFDEHPVYFMERKQ